MMKRGVQVWLATLVFLCSWAGAAHAYHMNGYVFCDGTGLPIPGAEVIVQGTLANGSSFYGTATSDANGYYSVFLGSEGIFDASIDLSGIGGGSLVGTSGSTHFSTYYNSVYDLDWLVSTPDCGQLGCWLTGGGTEFDVYSNTFLAEHGPQQNFGGNVYPSCDPHPGNGGQWTHVDHGDRLRLSGVAITVDRCGNADGIPPGSTSPVTPYNFIEFHGTGSLKSIKGNKVNYPNVCFWARAEDRNEPGSKGNNDGAGKDRYAIRVTDCNGNVLVDLDDPNLPGDLDAVPITGGNLQIHVSSCF